MEPLERKELVHTHPGMKDADFMAAIDKIAWGIWKAATAAEREACAKLVSDIGDDWERVCDMQKVAACDYLEDAIRMRANAAISGPARGGQ